MTFTEKALFLPLYELVLVCYTKSLPATCDICYPAVLQGSIDEVGQHLSDGNGSAYDDPPLPLEYLEALSIPVLVRYTVSSLPLFSTDALQCTMTLCPQKALLKREACFIDEV